MTISTGSCLCKKITFSVTKFQPLVGHCHCKMCQKFHGAAYSTFGEVKQEHLTWLSGEELLSHYRAENGSIHSFCKSCGASLLFESNFNRQENTIEISLAVFDELDAPTPNAHIYMESKAPWCEVNDRLPKFDGYRK